MDIDNGFFFLVVVKGSLSGKIVKFFELSFKCLQMFIRFSLQPMTMQLL